MNETSPGTPVRMAGVGSRSKRRAQDGGGTRPAWARLLLALAVGSLLAAPSARAAFTIGHTSQIVSGQGILPHSPWTPATRIVVTRGADGDNVEPSLTVSIIGEYRFNQNRDIAEIRVVRTSNITTSFNPTSQSDYQPGNYARWTADTGWEAFGNLTIDGTSTIRLPVPGGTGANNAHAYWVIFRTTSAIRGDITAAVDHRARFRVRTRVTGINSGTPPTSFDTGKDTAAITCEAQVVDMIPYSSMDFRGPGLPPGTQLEYVNAPLTMHNIIQPDHPAFGVVQRELMGLYDPYPLLGISVAGRSGFINVSGAPDTDVLNTVRAILEDSGRQGNFNPGLLASHPLSRYPNLTLWEDINGDGRFDPNVDRRIATVSSGAPWGVDHITVSAIDPSDAGNNRWEFRLNLVHPTQPSLYSGPTIPATVNGRPNFFLCATTVPDHGWVTTLPLYGTDFRMFAGSGDNLNFVYAGRTNTSQGGMAPYESELAEALTAEDNVMVPVDASGFNVPDPGTRDYVLFEGELTLPALLGGNSYPFPEYVSYTDIDQWGRMVGVTRFDYLGREITTPIILHHPAGREMHQPAWDAAGTLAQPMDMFQDFMLINAGFDFPDPDGAYDVFVSVQSEIMKYNDREDYIDPATGTYYTRLNGIQRAYFDDDALLAIIGNQYRTRNNHPPGQTVVFYRQPSTLAVALERSHQYGILAPSDPYPIDRILLPNDTRADQFPDPGYLGVAYVNVGGEWFSYTNRQEHRTLGYFLGPGNGDSFIALTGIRRARRSTSIGPHAAATPVVGEVPGIFLEDTKSAQLVFDIKAHPADPVEADGFPSPALMFNMCDSRNEPGNETLHWIRVHFRDATLAGGQRFTPSDLAPLADDQFSGVSLWQDQKRGFRDLDRQGLVDPRSGISELSIGDSFIPLSSDSLVWYNGTDDSLWSPENDDPNGHYYVLIKPKTAIELYPHDFVNDPPSYASPGDGLYKGMDYFIMVRGGGGGKSYNDQANWWERGPDFLDRFTVSIDSERDIQFGSGFQADPSLFPVTNTLTVSTVPTFFSSLGATRLNAHEETAVIGINLVAPPGRNISFNHFAFQILDTGAASFQISDLVDPNATPDNCGIALYRDDGYITGVFDPGDTRVRMTGLPRITTMPWMASNVHIIELDLDSTSVGHIPTSDDGNHAGPDYFLVLKPTPTADPGDSFQIRLHGSTMLGGRDDTIRFTNDGFGITHKRLLTGNMTVETITNDILTSRIPAGLQVYPGSPSRNAIGIEVHDPLGSATLDSLRVYFSSVGNLNPSDLLALLDGGAGSGLSVYRGNTHIPTLPTTWGYDFTDGIVLAGAGGQAPLSAGDQISWFRNSDRIVWWDRDKNGLWTPGVDALWWSASAAPGANTARYNPGAGDVLLRGTAPENTLGVVTHGGVYGFAYNDRDAAGSFTRGVDDIYFLGSGRRRIGYYADLVLATPNSLPTVATPNVPAYYVRFTPQPFPTIYGDLQFSLSLAANAVMYSTGHSFANTDVTTELITLRTPPTVIEDFRATRGSGEVALSWTLPTGLPFTSVMILRTEGPTPPDLGEIPELQVPYSVGQSVGRATIVYIGDGTSHLDEDLVNDTTYYYWAFAGDRDEDGNITPADMVQAVPFPVTPTDDVTPPLPISILTILRGDGQLTLEWTHEDIDDVGGYVIVRRQNLPPTETLVNEIIYTAGDFLDPPDNENLIVAVIPDGSVTTFTDIGLTNGETYYYAVYPYDMPARNYSAPSIGNSTPTDAAAVPNNVTNLSAALEVINMQRNVKLTWTWPASDLPAGLMLVRRQDAAVTGVPADGTVYAIGQDINSGQVVGHITDTNISLYTDFNLPGGSILHYTVFAYDQYFTYTKVGEVAGKRPVSISQTVPSVITQYTNLVAPAHTIDTESDPTSVIGINLMDPAGGRSVSQVNVQLRNAIGTDTGDLAPILAADVASGLAVYGRTAPGVFTLLPLASAPVWTGSGPWSATLNLAAGYPVPTSDAGANAGDDLRIVVRTSASASFGDVIQVSLPSGNGVVYDNGHAAVTGVSSNPMTVNMPLRLRNLVAPGQTIQAASAPTGTVGIDTADGVGQTERLASMIAQFNNVGGDQDVTPFDFAPYTDQTTPGALSIWRDARSPAPVSLAAPVTSTATVLLLSTGSHTAYPIPGAVMVGRELMRVTARTGNQLTVERGQAATVPASHQSGQPVQIIDFANVAVDGAHLANATEIDLTDASWLINPQGAYRVYVRIGSEIVGYTGITNGLTLTGCVRGAAGSSAAPLLGGEAVENAYAISLVGDLQAGALSVRVTDRPFAPYAPGEVAALTIGSEVITYTGAADMGDGTWMLNDVRRGARGTVTASHSDGTTILMGTVGGFDANVDSMVRYSNLPGMTMVQNVDFENQSIPARLDGVDDFFLAVSTSDQISAGDDFTVSIAPGNVRFTSDATAGKSIVSGVLTAVSDASTVVLQDVGGTPGASIDDTILFTFERAVDPDSITGNLIAGNTNFGFAPGAGHIAGNLAALVAQLGVFSDPGTVTATDCRLTMSADRRRLTITLGPAAWPAGNYVEPSGFFTPSPNLRGLAGLPFGGTFPVSGSFGVLDTTGTGVPDWWILHYFGTLDGFDPDADASGNGLTNIYEYWSGTNPLLWDTAGNGVSDYDEDFDRDGLTNGEEQRFGTRPDLPDTDRNGYSDLEEVLARTNPVYPISTPQPENRAFDLNTSAGTPVIIPHGGRFASGGSSWTIEAWFRMEGDQDGTIARYVTTSNNRTAMELGLDNGIPYARFETNGGIEYRVGGAAPLPALAPDTWTHLAAVWDRGNLSLQLYVDGQRRGALHSLQMPADGLGSMHMGEGFTSGAIDEFRVWQTVRSQAQIARHKRWLVQEGTPGLLAYYRFDDGGIQIEDFGAQFDGAAWNPNMGNRDMRLDPARMPPACGPDPADPAARHSRWVGAAGVPMLGIDDEDEDGLPDWWEHLYSGSRTGMNPGDDPDSDGLNNLYEYLCNTNPFDDDTAGNGILDGDEDFNNDGLSNALNQSHGTDPRREDTDDDGIPDLVEIRQGTNPADGNSPQVWRGVQVAGAGHVELPAQSRFALDAFTVEAWAKADAGFAAATGQILRRQYVSQLGQTVNYGLEYRRDGTDYRISAYFTSQAGTTVRATSTTIVPLDQWQHAAMSFDPASGALTLYLNGAVSRRVITAHTPATYGSGLAQTRLGEDFQGLLAEVRFWDVPLPAETISTNRHTAVPGDEPGLVAYYRLCDGGETAQDSHHGSDRDWLVGWANAGTLEGDAQFEDIAADFPPARDFDLDTNGNGLPDWWEMEHFGRLLAPGEEEMDFNGNGLPAYFEYLANIDPNDPDGNDAWDDPDGDGLLNIEEWYLGTDPGAADTDDNGIDDYTELFVLFTDPTNSLDPHIPHVARFDGFDSAWVEGSANNAQNTFTLAMWIKPDGLIPTGGNARGILQKRNRNGNGNYRLALLPGNRIQFSYDTAGVGRTVAVTSTRALPANQWSLVAARLDGELASGTFDVQVFVRESADGEFQRHTNTNSLLYAAPDTDPDGMLTLGFTEAPNPLQPLRTANIPERFVGELDEVVMWSRLLTNGEIADLLVQPPVPAAQAETPDESLAFYFKFDDGGQTAEDFAVVDDWKNGRRWAGGVLVDRAPHALQLSNPNMVVHGAVDIEGEPSRLPAWWRLYYFGALGVPGGGPDEDFDGDGLTNWYEYLAGTDPTLDDTSGNGVPDPDEDADGDGLTNLEEQNLGTHPGLTDTDDDGIPDAVHAAQGTSPANSLDPRKHLAGVPHSNVGPGRFVVRGLQERHRLPAWTIEARVYVEPDTDGDGNPDLAPADMNGIVARRALGRGTPDTVNFELGLSVGRPYVALTDRAGTRQTLTALDIVDTGRWVYLVATFDGEDLVLYVDDKAPAHLTGIDGCEVIGNAAQTEISMGAGYRDGTAFANTLPRHTRIDEIRLWNGVRTRARIVATRLNDLVSHVDLNADSETIHLVGYWMFDDGAGLDSGTYEDFTAASNNIDNLPDWFFGWPHAAYPEGGAAEIDEQYRPPRPIDDDDDIPYWWKVASGLNATNEAFDGINGALGIHGPDGDFDGDGLTNLEEYLGLDGVGQVNDGGPGTEIEYRYSYFVDRTVRGQPADRQLADGFARTLAYDGAGNVWLEISGTPGTFDGSDIAIVGTPAPGTTGTVVNLDRVFFTDPNPHVLAFHKVWIDADGDGVFQAGTDLPVLGAPEDGDTPTAIIPVFAYNRDGTVWIDQGGWYKYQTGTDHLLAGTAPPRGTVATRVARLVKGRVTGAVWAEFDELYETSDVHTYNPGTDLVVAGTPNPAEAGRFVPSTRVRYLDTLGSGSTYDAVWISNSGTSQFHLGDTILHDPSGILADGMESTGQIPLVAYFDGYGDAAHQALWIEGGANGTAYGIGNGTHPAFDDTDGDGIPDGIERHVYGTRADRADTDDNGISDFEELAQGTNPNSALSPYVARSVLLGGNGGVGLMRAKPSARHSLDTFTIEAWYRPIDLAGHHVLVSKRTGIGNRVNFELGIEPGGYPYARFVSDTGTARKLVSPQPLPAGSDWHHLAYVFSRENARASLHVNGVQQNFELTWLVPETSAGELILGARILADGTIEHAAHGYLDEVRIWSLARSNAEISLARNTELGGHETGLVSYFRMNDGEAAASPRFGAQDFASQGDMQASARGQGDYAFVSGPGMTPSLTPADLNNNRIPDWWEYEHFGRLLEPGEEDDDPDEDGLTNFQEYIQRTDPLNPDTSGDGMPDGWKVANNLDPLANDANEDPDGDGLTNLQEYTHGTNPLNPDTSGDGMPDGWKVANNLDPLANDANEDPDGDGLTNLEEYFLGTDPWNPDTSGDGMPDGWKVANNLDPLAATGIHGPDGDPDGDGLTNLKEYIHGTDPWNPDTSGDGMPDGWKVAHGLDPLAATGPHGPDGDPDNDGRTNLEEFYQGTHPLIPEFGEEDDDGDGLTNAQEWELGTDPNLADTDDDGFSDLEEALASTAGNNSLDKPGLDIEGYNGLNYNGNLVARLGHDEWLEVPHADTPAGQRLAFASWTVEARVRVHFGTGNRGYVDLDALNPGDEMYILRRVFGTADPADGSLTSVTDVNYALGLRVGLAADGSKYLYPFAMWDSGSDTRPADDSTVASIRYKGVRSGQWFHLAGRYDSEARTLSLFLDGVEIAQRTGIYGHCPSLDYTKQAFVRIGEQFSGDLDEIRVWGVEPSRLRQETATGQVKPLPGIVRTDAEIALNADRSVIPTRGAYSGSLRDHYNLYNLPEGTFVADTQVTDGPWHTTSGTRGALAGNVFFDDANGNGSWDPGEDVWRDNPGPESLPGIYDEETDILIAVGADGPTVAPGTVGTPLAGLYYHDVDHDGQLTANDDAWLDYTNQTSWYQARRAVWAEAMGLALYLKFDDNGEHIEDFAWHANWRADWNRAIRVGGAGTAGLALADVIYDGNLAPTRPNVVVAPASERFVDRNGNGVWDPGEPFNDISGTGAWSPAEPAWTDANGNFFFTDLNGNGVWDNLPDPFDDLNGNGIYDPAEEIIDDDGDGVFNPTTPRDALLTGNVVRAARDPEGGTVEYLHRWFAFPVPNGTAGTPSNVYFTDRNGNGVWDIGEEVWADLDSTGLYSGPAERLYDGGYGWTTEVGTAGVGPLTTATIAGTAYYWQDRYSSDPAWNYDVGAENNRFDVGFDRMVPAVQPVATTPTLDLDGIGTDGATYFLFVSGMDTLGAIGESGWAFVTATSQTSPAPPTMVDFAPNPHLPGGQHPGVGENLVLTLRNTQTIGGGGPAMRMTVEWYRNWELALVQESNGTVADGTVATFTLPASHTEHGDAWSFRAYAVAADGSRSRATRGATGEDVWADPNGTGIYSVANLRLSSGGDGVWDTLDGTPGTNLANTPGTFRYHDANTNGKWDIGEEIWRADSGATSYGEGDTQVSDGGDGIWTTPFGTAGTSLQPSDNILFHDLNQDGSWTYSPAAVDVRIIGGTSGSALNLPPTQPNVSIGPAEPYTEDMLFCNATGSTDPEGDPWAYHYQWFLALPGGGGFAFEGLNSPILEEVFTEEGQRWYCEVYAEDVYGNRSHTVRSATVTVHSPGSSGLGPYEPNNTMATARRIIPQIDPTDVDDDNAQDHAFTNRDDQDWFWFVVERVPGVQKSRVIFETSNGSLLFNQSRRMTDDNGTDTQLWLYDSNGTRLLYVDDYGNRVGPGGTRFARFDMELAPGIYYVNVMSEIHLNLVEGVNNEYRAHLIIESAAGVAGPTPPTTVTLAPAMPTSADKLQASASGATSSLGPEAVEYWYVWYRDGDVVPFGAGAQPYEGNNYLLANRKPDLDADGLPANVVANKYTREGEVWTVVVFAADAYGESEPVASNSVTIGGADWQHTLRVGKTFNDGTPSVGGDEQAVTIGWAFGATHGFDENHDVSLPGPLPAPGTPGGVVPGGSGELLPAGRSYSMGIEPTHSMLTTDLRPYGATTSWYIKIELGNDPASCRLSWDGIVTPEEGMPVTITRVVQDAHGDFHTVPGTTIDMTSTNELVVPQNLVEELVDAHANQPGKAAVIYRVSLGDGETSFSLEVKPGWNLLSLPIQPNRIGIDDILVHNGQKAYAGTVWAYENGIYVATQTMQPLKGYWVYSPFTQTVSIPVFGIRVRTPIQLKAGWNLAGVATTLERSRVYGPYGPAGLNAVDVDSISQYNPETGVYTVPTYLEPGAAYWFRAMQAIELPSVP